MRIPLILLTLFHFSLALANPGELRSAAGAAAANGDIPGALTHYRALLKQLPEDGAAHYQIGSLLMDNEGDLNEAISHFKQAAKSGFQVTGVSYRLSRIYARQGETEKALKEFEKLAPAGFSLISLIEGQKDYESLAGNERFEKSVNDIRALRYPCLSDPRRRAFDFWIGDWTVTVGGQFAGNSNITSILGGCTIFEQWENAAGGLGKSFNYYDPAHDHWRQIWVDDSGNVIEFTGEAKDGGIYYTAETINPADRVVTHHKFQFTRNEDGSVRQFWQTSPEIVPEKANWTTIWDGHYARKK
jgi:tetratricopeptide (TPR) repeat protein